MIVMDRKQNEMGFVMICVYIYIYNYKMEINGSILLCNVNSGLMVTMVYAFLGVMI